MSERQSHWPAVGPSGFRVSPKGNNRERMNPALDGPGTSLMTKPRKLSVGPRFFASLGGLNAFFCPGRSSTTYPAGFLFKTASIWTCAGGLLRSINDSASGSGCGSGKAPGAEASGGPLVIRDRRNFVGRYTTFRANQSITVEIPNRARGLAPWKATN